jgi:hypothetical protein
VRKDIPREDHGTTVDRPQLAKLMKALAPGDIVVTPAVGHPRNLCFPGVPFSDGSGRISRKLQWASATPERGWAATVAG